MCVWLGMEGDGDETRHVVIMCAVSNWISDELPSRYQLSLREDDKGRVFGRCARLRSHPGRQAMYPLCRRGSYIKARRQGARIRNSSTMGFVSAAALVLVVAVAANAQYAVPDPYTGLVFVYPGLVPGYNAPLIRLERSPQRYQGGNRPNNRPGGNRPGNFQGGGANGFNQGGFNQGGYPGGANGFNQGGLPGGANGFNQGGLHGGGAGFPAVGGASGSSSFASSSSQSFNQGGLGGTSASASNSNAGTSSFGSGGLGAGAANAGASGSAGGIGGIGGSNSAANAGTQTVAVGK
ncbi:Hypothetical predicted protein [Cloeon dipterum]|uniref:Uncharacterized protein n=2 Tax=Cloeon dipterum TaxID=197152 RepID=A0A8S1E1T5_9INSE|nr:Hypothetical predicted protein [Cloeon dipterum]